MSKKPTNVTSTITTGPYATIKAATEAGFRKRKDWEYGGEEITIKGRLLARDPKEALSQTEWSKRGYRVRHDAKPLCYRTAHFSGGGTITYPVYHEDQVEPKRKVSSTPPVQIDVLAAIWVINRRAKRCRNMASTYYNRGKHGLAATCKREKAELYRLKGQSLHYLFADGQLEIVGHHRFPDGNRAEVLKGGGYTFHRPCPPQGGAHVEDRDEIEAKPKGAKEPRLKDALHTINTYLEGKPTVEAYQWPVKVKARAPQERYYGALDAVDGNNFDEDVEW